MARRNTVSETRLKQALSAARGSGATVYAIRLGPDTATIILDPSLIAADAEPSTQSADGKGSPLPWPDD